MCMALRYQSEMAHGSRRKDYTKIYLGGRCKNDGAIALDLEGSIKDWTGRDCIVSNGWTWELKC